MKRVIVMSLMCLCLTGCSAIMALSGEREANLSTLKIGQHRQEVILHLGQPAKTLSKETGRIDEFKLQRGNAPSAGRAVGHLFMDAITFGFWEIIGVPIEAIGSSSMTLTIEYNEEDRVKSFNTGDEQKLL